MPEFSFLARIVVNCEPGKEFINCIFLPQTKIRMQILSTEPIMYRGHGVVHSKFLMGGSVPPHRGGPKGGTSVRWRGIGVGFATKSMWH